MITTIFAEFRQKLQDFKILANAQEPEKRENRTIYLKLTICDVLYVGIYDSPEAAEKAFEDDLSENPGKTEEDLKRRLVCEKALETLRS